MAFFGFARLMYSFNCIVYLIWNNAFRGIQNGFNGLLCFDKVVFIFQEIGDWRPEPGRKAKAIRIFWQTQHIIVIVVHLCNLVVAIFPGLLNVYLSYFGNVFYWMVLQGPIHLQFLWLVFFILCRIIDAFNSK